MWPVVSRWSASSAPTSSPRSIRQPWASGTATAHRSASGSLATTRSTPRSRGQRESPGPSRRAPRGWGRPRSGSPGRAAPAAPRRTAPRSPAVSSTCDDRGAARRRAAACRRSRRSRGPSPASPADGVEVAVDDVLVERPPAAGRGARRRAARPRRCRRRDLARRPAARSGCRRRGRPCSRCRAAGCGSRSPSRPATQPSSRIANASSGRGQRTGQHERAQAGAGHHVGGVAGEDVGVVAGVVADHDRGVRGRPPWSLRYAASPAAARITTTRFIRLEPAPELAAQTGGAELQGAVEPVGEVRRCHRPRSARSSSARVSGSGSSAAQARARSIRSVTLAG